MRSLDCEIAQSSCAVTAVYTYTQREHVHNTAIEFSRRPTGTGARPLNALRTSVGRYKDAVQPTLTNWGSSQP